MSAIETREIAIPAGTWKVDPSHSRVEFSIRHMGIASIRGSFADFDAVIAGGEQPHLSGAIRVGSVDTRDEARDGHLQSPDFFDAERYPEIAFTSSRFEDGKVVGDLTIRGVTREVDLKVEFDGVAKSPWGQEVVAFTATTEFDREEFGITWNQALETGGVLVGKKIAVQISAEGVRQAAE